MSIFGTDGRAQITVDTLGFLANTLRGYEATSILREQLQNADDACHKQQRPGELRLEFLADRLLVTNPSVFSDEDWRRVITPSSRGKFTDADQTGEFGIGFWGSLHLTDTPIITSGTRRVTLDPRGSGAHAEEVAAIDGTRFEFPYRRTPTDIGTGLDVGVIDAATERSMLDEFVNQMADLLLFTRAIDTITLVSPQGTLRARRTLKSIAESVDSLSVEVEGAPEQNCRYIVVRSEIADPPQHRHGRVSVALPVAAAHAVGRVFVTFPTETPTGLNFSIDAHFRATDDRRSLQNDGEHGEWNARIFQAAGRAAGEALETLLDQTLTSVEYGQAVRWFENGAVRGGWVGLRAAKFVAALDSEAVSRAVVPDALGVLRPGNELANLELQIERILGGFVGNTLQPGHPVEVLQVLRRWGLTRWGSTEVATWLAQNLSTEPMPRKDSPTFLQDLEDAITLLDYCKSDAHRLVNSALIRADREDVYYPVREGIARTTHEMSDLVEGLDRPTAHHNFARTALGQMLPATNATWLDHALRDSAHRLLGKRLPVKSMGVAKDRRNLKDALQILRRGRRPLLGVPLALDETGTLQAFTEQTVGSLPSGPGRKPVAALCRRLGLEPLHADLDEDTTGEVESFSLSLVLDRLGQCENWDPVEDSRLLVEVIHEVAREREPSAVLLASFRERPIWASSDGIARPLSDLRLPARSFRGTPSIPLLHPDLVGELEPAATVFATFNGLLGVDVLDGTEEFVMECEAAPNDPDERRLLLEVLGELERFTEGQAARLRKAAFVLCRDGKLKIPNDVLLTDEALPLSLGDRRVDELGLVGRANKHLLALGARRLPSTDDLTGVAHEIAAVEPDSGQDPALTLWSFLTGRYSDYTDADLLPLSQVPWLTSSPGPQRRAPKDCLDPKFVFAAMVFPVPVGVGTPSVEMREKLRMKANLEAADYVRIGNHAAENELMLAEGFFRLANNQAIEGSEFASAVGGLRSTRIIPLSTGGQAPDRLVPRSEAHIWRHLRELVPESFERDYRNLARTWGMSDQGEIDWRLHLDVLEEIGTLAAPDDQDLALARERLESLAEIGIGQSAAREHRLGTIRRRAVVVTSLGIYPLNEAYRGDLPPSTLERLKRFLPIVEEWDRVAPFLDLLELTGVRSVVRLEPIFEDPVPEPRWQQLLGEHAQNLYRFMKASVAGLDAGFALHWPPTVVAVRNLSVRATIESELVDEWNAEAHLSDVDGMRTMYVQSSGVDHRAIVDALSVQYGIDQTKKSLLLSVLRGTQQDGSAELDWANVPRLSSAEAAEVYVHSEAEIVFAEEKNPSPALVERELSSTSETPAEPETAIRTCSEPETTDAEHISPSEALVWRDSSDETERADPSSPDERSRAGDGTTPRVQSPRGTTDPTYLEEQGITTTYDLDEEASDTDYRPDHDPAEPVVADEVKVCLSYYDVLHGQFPIDAQRLGRLTTGTELREIVMFGEKHSARQNGVRHVQISDGSMVFAARQIVPGTIIRVYPSSPGVVEAVLRPDPHRVDGVWMLELDDDGELIRLVQNDLELQWETDDAFYRSERRLEDIEALMMDGGKSALQLIIEVFAQRPEAGLSADELWGLVAVSRLFAKATIATHLGQQSGLFEQRDGLWFKVGSELRRQRVRSAAPSQASTTARPSAIAPRPTRAAKNQADEVMRVARKLVRMLESTDPETLRQVRAVMAKSQLRASK